MYRKTAFRFLTFPLFHVFTRVVIVQLFLLGDDVADSVNNFKLFARRSHLDLSRSTYELFAYNNSQTHAKLILRR